MTTKIKKAKLQPINKVKKRSVVSSESIEYAVCEWSEGANLTYALDLNKNIILIESGLFQETLSLGTKVEIRKLKAGQKSEVPPGAEYSLLCLKKGTTSHFKIIESRKTNENIFDKVPIKDAQAMVKLGRRGMGWPMLKKICQNIENESISTFSPYFMNQLYSGVYPTTILAEEVLSRTRTIISTLEAAPVFSFVEIEVVNSLIELIGWRDGGEGIPVPGGTSANFMALHCAKHQRFPESKKSGLRDIKVAVFASKEAHYCIEKACAVLGMGQDSYFSVDTDDNGRMKIESLEKLIARAKSEGRVPLMVCATAGSTLLGAFDPISEISKICKKNGIWLHVDGAWGGPILFSKKHRGLLGSIERADSISLDTHKLLGSNPTCSFFLTSHKNLLLEANDITGGEYLFHDTDGAIVDRGRLTWQCSRKADAFSFWMLWQSLGTDGIGEFIDKMMDQRDELVRWLSKNPRFELIAQPDYLNICVKIHPLGNSQDARLWSRNVREVLREKNIAFINYFEDEENGSYLRLILANPRLNIKNLKDILNAALAVESVTLSTAA